MCEPESGVCAYRRVVQLTEKSVTCADATQKHAGNRFKQRDDTLLLPLTPLRVYKVAESANSGPVALIRLLWGI